MADLSGHDNPDYRALEARSARGRIGRKTEEQIRQYKLIKIRGIRNQLLAVSDIQVTIDKWKSYSQETKDIWKTYRQNLRDFPQSVQDSNNPEWPSNPSVTNNR